MPVIFAKRVIITAVLLYPPATLAYVGPGLGLGAIGLILGVIGSIILALIAVFWYPLKRLIKKNKNQHREQEERKGEPARDGKPAGGNGRE